MTTLKICVLLLLLHLPLFADQQPRLGRLLSKAYPAMGPAESRVVLVTFADKDARSRALLAAPSRLVSPRSLERRAKRGTSGALVGERDLPLAAPYVRAVGAIAPIRHELRWFNAVSVTATKAQIDAIARLPFVAGIELVGRWRAKVGDEQPSPEKAGELPPAPSGVSSLDYGTSFTQNNQINVVAVHDLGIYGQGVMVGVFDNGFRLPSHVAFDSMTIVAEYDFVDHKVSTVPLATSSSFGSHGINTLSTIGGYAPGQLIGPAFKAQYVLARTENDSSETPVEEDNWVAAIAWADSIGIDVATTSLGYLTYDAPYTSWTAADMDGATTLITQAADLASANGIVVVNSAGNNGPGDGVHNTLNAPADGFNVITVGAVTSAGVRSSFSSVGPTTDVPARIKPDVMAMGSSVKVASATNPTGYGTSSGTSFSCPLSAGVAALILCANPALTPFQVREAMRNTANNAGSPNNQYGWGILNALAAIQYYPPSPVPSIAGSVFHDRNANAVRDPGEEGIAGATVHLGGALSATRLTDALGAFLFDSLVVGNFTVDVDSVPGWIRTTAPGAAAVAIDSLAQDVTGVTFGLRTPGRIAGSVFRDINMNGSREPGEPALAGAVFHLDGPASFRAVSDGSGAFSFAGLDPGTYVLAESLQAGWIQTAPAAPETIAVASATDDTNHLYANYLPGEYWVSGGWNILSLPLDAPDTSPSVLYPSASSSAYQYGPGYTSGDPITPGEGYWIKFPSAALVTITGEPVYEIAIPVTVGWNLVGAPALPFPVASIGQSPPGIVLTPFYAYNGAQYVTSDTLRPHFGYWVKVSSAGTLTVGAPGAAGASAAPSRPALESPLGTLTVRDAADAAQVLRVLGSSAVDRAAFELPPSPPAGAFDARFASQRPVEFLDGEEGAFGVLVSSPRPVRLAWESPAGLAASVRRSDGAEFALLPGRSVEVGGSAFTLVVRRGTGAALPAAFALGQNYPNPFNPATSVSFSMPAASRVTLTVVSLLGETVATLVDEERPAGTYQAAWDASGVPSGAYFLRMRAGGFTAVRSMLLLK